MIPTDYKPLVIDALNIMGWKNPEKEWPADLANAVLLIEKLVPTLPPWFTQNGPLMLHFIKGLLECPENLLSAVLDVAKQAWDVQRKMDSALPLLDQMLLREHVLGFELYKTAHGFKGTAILAGDRVPVDSNHRELYFVMIELFQKIKDAK
jgi:hypothetical protein